MASNNKTGNKNELTVGELRKKLENYHDDDVVAVSDYFGGDHVLYSPSVSHFEKGQQVKINRVDGGGSFAHRDGSFKKNTIYIGHPTK